MGDEVGQGGGSAQSDCQGCKGGRTAQVNLGGTRAREQTRERPDLNSRLGHQSRQHSQSQSQRARDWGSPTCKKNLENPALDAAFVVQKFAIAFDPNYHLHS